MDEVAWRGYVIVGPGGRGPGRSAPAQRVVEETLAFTTERDLAVAGMWHLSMRAVVHALTGRWSAAREDAPRCRPAARPMEPSGRTSPSRSALSAGDQDATAHLERGVAGRGGGGRAAAVPPCLAALAEAVVHRPADPRVTDYAVTRLTELARHPTVGGLRRPGRLAEAARAGLRGPTGLAEPYLSLLEGRTAVAAEWWHRTGHTFAEALAYADSPDPEDRAAA